jgi:hypothetical protein
MPSAERIAKLPPAAPLAENLLGHKLGATTIEFRPKSRTHDRETEPALVPVAPDPPAPSAPPIPPEAANAEAPAPSLRADETAIDEQLAAKQALAANLAEVIENMLETTQFATAATASGRQWVTPASSAPDADPVITGSSLSEELARARPAPETAPAAPRRRWVDAVLALVCAIMVLSAGYYASTL